jgi:hypothetical protein
MTLIVMLLISVGVFGIAIREFDSHIKHKEDVEYEDNF